MLHAYSGDLFHTEISKHNVELGPTNAVRPVHPQTVWL